MGGLVGPKTPKPPKPVQQPNVPTPVDEEVVKARGDERRRAALSQGRNSTILTSPQGLPSLTTTGKTLLGT